jgi:hypothetical protein
MSGVCWRFHARVSAGSQRVCPPIRFCLYSIGISIWFRACAHWKKTHKNADGHLDWSHRCSGSRVVAALFEQILFDTLRLEVIVSLQFHRPMAKQVRYALVATQGGVAADKGQFSYSNSTNYFQIRVERCQ